MRENKSRKMLKSQSEPKGKDEQWEEKKVW